MNQQAAERNVSIVDLPGIVTDLFARAGRPLLPDAEKGPGLFVRYLRRKPARGLAVIYAVDEIGRRSEHAHDPNRSVSLTLDEPALEGARIRFNANQAHRAALEIEASGVLRAEELALSVQAFPADDGLPALAVSLDASHGAVFEALQHAARMQLGSEAWRLTVATSLNFLFLLMHGTCWSVAILPSPTIAILYAMCPHFSFLCRDASRASTSSIVL